MHRRVPGTSPTVFDLHNSDSGLVFTMKTLLLPMNHKIQILRISQQNAFAVWCGSWKEAEHRTKALFDLGKVGKAPVLWMKAAKQTPSFLTQQFRSKGRSGLSHTLALLSRWWWWRWQLTFRLHSLFEARLHLISQPCRNQNKGNLKRKALDKSHLQLKVPLSPCLRRIQAHPRWSPQARTCIYMLGLEMHLAKENYVNHRLVHFLHKLFDLFLSNRNIIWPFLCTLLLPFCTSKVDTTLLCLPQQSPAPDTWRF